jgi:hypothetical protein
MGKSQGSLRTFAKANGYKVRVLPKSRAGEVGRYQVTGGPSGRSNFRSNTVDSTRRLLSSAVRSDKKFAKRHAAEVARIRAGR